MKQILVFLLAVLTLPVDAQKQKIGDMIESTSYNLDKIGVSRQQQYRPMGDAFVCDNGQNRYTRALYGSHTDWRLETSDRPIFAVVKKDHNRNIRFVAICDGKEYPMEQAFDCRASYVYGRRDYTLSSKDWGQAQIKLSAYNKTATLGEFDK